MYTYVTTALRLFQWLGLKSVLRRHKNSLTRTRAVLGLVPGLTVPSLGSVSGSIVECPVVAVDWPVPGPLDFVEEQHSIELFVSDGR